VGAGASGAARSGRHQAIAGLYLERRPTPAGVTARVHPDTPPIHKQVSDALGSQPSTGGGGFPGVRRTDYARSNPSRATWHLQLIRERARLYEAGEARSLEPAESPFSAAAFEVGDADPFFGRERLVAELIACLPAPGLGVVGPSGSGSPRPCAG
jgi:hypothetical protein